MSSKFKKRMFNKLNIKSRSKSIAVIYEVYIMNHVVLAHHQTFIAFHNYIVHLILWNSKKILKLKYVIKKVLVL